jgi:hypothetical protein
MVCRVVGERERGSLINIIKYYMHRWRTMLTTVYLYLPIAACVFCVFVCVRRPGVSSAFCLHPQSLSLTYRHRACVCVCVSASVAVVPERGPIQITSRWSGRKASLLENLWSQ